MNNTIAKKVFTWETIQPLLAKWRFLEDQIVFTNGCFDILHYGHIHYLAEAKSLGHRLVVGLNSDASVKRLKGEHRPIKDQQTRQYLLAALQCVDAVLLFEEDTPYELIKIIQPEVLVKGGDWQVDQIIGSDIVLAKAGTVKSLQFIEGYSTTSIETKIKNS